MYMLILYYTNTLLALYDLMYIFNFQHLYDHIWSLAVFFYTRYTEQLYECLAPPGAGDQGWSWLLVQQSLRWRRRESSRWGAWPWFPRPKGFRRLDSLGGLAVLRVEKISTAEGQMPSLKFPGLDGSWWISEILLLSAASSHSRKKQILVLPISHDLTELWANLCVKVLPVMICNVETRGNSGNHTRQRQIPIFASPYAWLIFSLPPLNAACGNTVNLRIFCPKMSSRNPCKEL